MSNQRLKAVDLPEVRAKMLAWMDSEHGSYVFQQTQLMNDVLNRKISAEEANLLHKQERSRWQMSELFYVSAQMTQLALTAAETIPEFSLIPADLPSEYGLMVFESPIGMSLQPSGTNDYPLTSVLWGPTTMTQVFGRREVPGVWLSYYTSPPEALPDRPLGYDQEGWMGFEENAHPVAGTSHKDSTARWAIVMRCAWLLMQQTVSSVTELHMDRATQRRLARRNVDLMRVRVVRLRHVASSSGDHSEREYHYQWVVRGHWRRQWYARQERHVPIWISPHVKGPDGAPLLGGEKVYAWTR